MRRRLAMTLVVASCVLAGPTYADEAVTKPILLEIISSMVDGSPGYDMMQPTLKSAVRQQMPDVRRQLRSLGDVVEASFEGEQDGYDVYTVEFRNGFSTWMIQLADNGKIAGLWFQ